MSKRAKASIVEKTAPLDALVVEYMHQERSPADAGRKAGIAAFDGLGASIMAIVSQRTVQQTCAD